jgi:uncharacterized metal-binding protein (TIGR02443 family)
VSRRRFIAGAVCPRCSAMDKIIVNLDTDARECVSCGFSEPRPRGDTQVAEPPTRVSRAAARRIETPTEAVRILDLPLESDDS